MSLRLRPPASQQTTRLHSVLSTGCARKQVAISGQTGGEEGNAELAGGRCLARVTITVEYSENQYRSIAGPIVHDVTVRYEILDHTNSVGVQLKTPRDAIKDAVRNIDSVYDPYGTFVAKSGVFISHNEELKVPKLQFRATTPNKSKPPVQCARDFQQQLINELVKAEGVKDFSDMEIKPAEPPTPLNFDALDRL